MKFSQALALVGLLFTCQVYSETIYLDLTDGKVSEEETYTISVGDVIAVTVDVDTTGSYSWSPYSSDSTVISWTTNCEIPDEADENTTTFCYEAVASGVATINMMYLLSTVLSELTSGTWDQEIAESSGYIYDAIDVVVL